jgi:hypothetical protein
MEANERGISVTTAIHLGFEVGSGRAVDIPLRHTAVTGQTQESGKTTTLEGLISRSGLRAVAYVTKRGESSFHVMHPIAPYFQERADWKFVQSLLEASTETKLKFEQSWIMRASEGAKTLQDVRANIQKFIKGVKDTSYVPRKAKRSGRSSQEADQIKERWLQKPARGLSGDIYYVLDKYLDDVMPQLQQMPYSTKLKLAAGLNVMDLRDYEFPLQALVVRSVIDWTREHEENTINVIPEAWKFAPKQKGSPVRQSAEELIREGGALKNFLWIDSQDLAGVADVLMRQVGVWIFGVQRARHEIERALDHMPEGLPARRPRPQDIATLNKGQFYVCYGREMFKVYVQPAWMTAAHAEAIARGEEDVDSARDILKEFDHEQKNRRDPDGDESKRAPHRIYRNSHQDADGVRGLADQSGRSVSRSAEGSAEVPGTVLASSRTCKPINDANEETMWKEKYEVLKEEFEQLREAHDALAEKLRTMFPQEPAVISGKAAAARVAGDGGRLAASSATDSREHIGVNGQASLNDIYGYVRQRAAKDPGILELLREHPELRVTRQRRTLEMSDTTTPGRIALLIAEKFFDAPQNSGQVTKEFKRRGWFETKTSNAAVLKPLAQIAEMGFLTRDGSNYQAVPEMRVNIVEA